MRVLLDMNDRCWRKSSSVIASGLGRAARLQELCGADDKAQHFCALAIYSTFDGQYKPIIFRRHTLDSASTPASASCEERSTSVCCVACLLASSVSSSTCAHCILQVYNIHASRMKTTVSICERI